MPVIAKIDTYNRSGISLLTNIINKSLGENMAKRGRPRKINKAQNRIISVVLTEKAAILFRKIKNNSQYNGKWIHRLVSEVLIDRFGKEFDEEIILEEIKMLQDERDKYSKDMENKLRKKVNELQKLREKKIIIETQKILDIKK